MIKAASSLSKPATSVLNDAAILLRSTEMNGVVYWIRALCRICSYNVSTWSYRWMSRRRSGFSFWRYPRQEAYRLHRAIFGQLKLPNSSSVLMQPTVFPRQNL